MADTSKVVYAVDDDPRIGESVDQLVQTVGLRGEVHLGGASFLASFDPGAVACVVLDLRMPDMSGPELLARLHERGHRVPVIFLSGYADPQIVARVFREGAFDFIEKPFGPQYLLDRIRAALTLVEEARALATQVEAIAVRRRRLSPRESTVLELVVRGYSNKRVAEELGLSSKTIEVHRSHAMRKMGAESLAQLVRQTLTLEWYAAARYAPAIGPAMATIVADGRPKLTIDHAASSGLISLPRADKTSVSDFAAASAV